MTTDRAGSNSTIRTERRIEARMGLFGFYTAITVNIPSPWASPSILQGMLDSLKPNVVEFSNPMDPTSFEPAKPVGTVSRDTDSSS